MIIGRDHTQEWYLGAPLSDEVTEAQIDTQVGRLLSVTAPNPPPFALEDALEFDEVLGQEELFLTLCEEPLSYQKLRAVLRQQVRRDTPPPTTLLVQATRCTLSTIRFNKTAR